MDHCQASNYIPLTFREIRDQQIVLIEIAATSAYHKAFLFLKGKCHKYFMRENNHKTVLYSLANLSLL